MQRTRIAVLFTIASLLAVAPANAVVVPGGGSVKSDCFSEYEVDAVDSASRTSATCMDGDACDADGACGNRSCTFRVRVCVNRNDPDLPQCTPPPSVRLIRKRVNGVQGSLAADLVGGPIAGETCSVFSPFTLAPRGASKPGKGRVRLTAVASSGKPKSDRDVLVLVCQPRLDASTCPAGTTTTTVVATSTSTSSTSTTSSSSTSTSAPSTTSTSTSSTTTTTEPGPTTTTEPEPTTTSTTSTTTTSSSSTTSTSLPPITCEGSALGALVTLAGDAPKFSGVQFELDYPPDKVGIPGSADAEEVLNRVEDVGTPFAEILVVNDRDTDQDQQDDQLFVLYSNSSEGFTAGPLVRVTFDCPSGTRISPSEIACTVTDASDPQTNPLSGTCVVSFPGTGPTSTTSTSSTLQETTSTSTSSTSPETTSTSSTTLQTTSTSTSSSSSTSLQPTSTSTSSTSSSSSTSTSQAPTTTTSTSTTTSTTAGPPVCGNSKIEGDETCDDGNVVDGDACPSNCRVLPCPGPTTQLLASVAYARPATVSVAGLSLFLDYPDGRAGFAGTGTAVTDPPTPKIRASQTGFTVRGNDRDYGVAVSMLSVTRTLNPASPILALTMELCAGATQPPPGDFKCKIVSASNLQGGDLPLTGISCAVTIP